MNQTIDVRDLLKNLSKQDFQNLGLAQVAYVRPIMFENKTAYAIHAADGSRLLVADTPNNAAIIIEQNDLEVTTVH